jgi:hypothetical protein
MPHLNKKKTIGLLLCLGAVAAARPPTTPTSAGT